VYDLGEIISEKFAVLFKGLELLAQKWVSGGFGAIQSATSSAWGLNPSLRAQVLFRGLLVKIIVLFKGLELLAPKFISGGFRQQIYILCLCALLLTSCASSPDDTNIDRIQIGTTTEVKTLDPADAYEQSSAMVIYNLGDRLYTYKPGTTELQPQLATTLPTISSDGLTYKIPLRSGVLFHDSTPFNAEAMVFSLKRFIENKGRPSFLLSSIVKSVEATGEYELTITLQQSFAAFASLLTYPGLCPVSPKAYELGEGKFKPDTFVSTGPYKLGTYSSDLIRLEPFDRYWGEKPVNSGIDLQRFSSGANLYNAFRTGAVDVAYQSLDADQVHSLEELAPQEGWQVLKTDSPAITYLVVNLKQPPLDRQEVRQALATAIDRQLLNERVLYGQGEPLYTLIPTAFDSSQPVFEKKYGDGDLAKAKELFKKAGFSANDPLDLEIWYASDSPAASLGVTVIKAVADRDLDGLLKIEPRAVESATAYSYLDKGVYPVFWLSWIADFFDADNYIKPFIDCEKGSPKTGCEEGESQYHGSFYYSKKANQLIAQQRQERDPKARTDQLVQLQNLIAEDVPFIPLWQSKDYVFAQKEIAGVQLNSTQQLLPFWTIDYN
jgi:peptide/nickel transport system substrate-binding protein